MISFESVTRQFRLDADTVITPVLDVSLEIGQGEFIIIVGRSGTGKTTLLNLAAGLVKPTSGRVLIEGNDLARMRQQTLSNLRSRKIGFIFQFPSLIPALNIRDNISLPAIFTGEKRNDNVFSRVAELLCALGLEDKLNVFPRQLSAGETKRVVLARALINKPSLILADEPTSDLDERTEQEVMTLLQNVGKQGVTIVIVTHNLQLLPFASRAFEMESGRLREVEQPAKGISATL